jgi:hypothetical protein
MEGSAIDFGHAPSSLSFTQSLLNHRNPEPFFFDRETHLPLHVTAHLATGSTQQTDIVTNTDDIRESSCSMLTTPS